MNLNRKHSVLIAFLFSLYCTGSVFFLLPFVFLEEHSSFISYVFLFVAVGALSFGLLRVTSHSLLGTSKQLLVVAAIYTIPLVSGSTLLLIYSAAENELFLYLSTFLILPILPVAIYILWLIYSDLQARVLITTENRENSDLSVEKLFRINNDKNQVVLEIPIKRILSCEANDNYVITYYMNEVNKVDKAMHRISLKKITELLTKMDVEFMRVHKSFLVNPDFIVALHGKAQSYRVEVQHLSKTVPISRSFDVVQIKNYRS